MTNHPSLHISIEATTNNDDHDDHNTTIAQQRIQTIENQITSHGLISIGRIRTSIHNNNNNTTNLNIKKKKKKNTNTVTIRAIQIIQLLGTIKELKREELINAKNQYLEVFAYAETMNPKLWIMTLTFIKMTHNKLGFGKKLIWEEKVNE
jgi:hypothetical protein